MCNNRGVLKILYDFGNQSALNVMLDIFSDKNQTYEIRLLCLDLLSSIDSPLVKDALKNTVENVEFLENKYVSYILKLITREYSIRNSRANII